MYSSAVKTLKVIVDQSDKILSVYNYPNPFKTETYFTFRLTGIPDELQINIYTITGRLIKKIIKYSPELKTDFNSIYWDGRDEDGDFLANGVYFYKLITKNGSKSNSITQKMVVVR